MMALTVASWLAPEAKAAAEWGMVILDSAWRGAENCEHATLASLARQTAIVRAMTRRTRAALNEWRESVTHGS